MMDKCSYLLLVLVLLSCKNTQVYDFESQFTGLQKQSPPTPYAIRRISDFARRGDYCVRFELREGEKWNNSHRSEYKDFFSAAYGKEYWYGISIYIPLSFPIHDNRNVIMQWYAPPDAGEISRSPVLSFRYNNGNIYIHARHDKDKIQKRKNGNDIILGVVENYLKGEWVDFIINVKWSYHDSGFVKVFMNSDKIVNYSGPVGYNDDKGPYFKFGIYRDDVPETYVIYFDEYRRGYSYKDVDPSNPDN